MNILWDFRLFSYGYSGRGVGVWTSAMADSLTRELSAEKIIIWGEKSRVPSRFHSMASQWIEYIPGSWKSDLFLIPVLIARYHVKIFHYWIALGPLFRIGVGLGHPLCKTCLTVHDCGVEFWHTTPSCVSMRKTQYWKFQKRLFPHADLIVCNSRATQTDVDKMFPGSIAKSVVLYPPLRYYGRDGTKKREKRFIALSGEFHKNTDNVIEAFREFFKNRSDYSLVVLGEHEGARPHHPGLSFESMGRYTEYLENSAGLIVCSLYEGLGLPVIEALMRNCPLVISDIPVFHEICADAGIFVDPLNCQSIFRGMETCARQGEDWTTKASHGAARYSRLSAGTGRKLLGMYLDLTNKT